MSPLRFDEACEKVFHVRIRQCGWQRSPAELFRDAEFLRHVRHGQGASALIAWRRVKPGRVSRAKIPRGDRFQVFHEPVRLMRA